MARVFMVNLHLSLLGMSWPVIWPMIEIQAQLRSAIQSRMTFLDFNDINFGKLQLIVNVSFQVMNASTATIHIRSTCSPLHTGRSILVLLHSHHVFFGFESVDAVRTDCHLSRHCTFRCRRLISLAVC
jgi:hypothetical protein